MKITFTSTKALKTFEMNKRYQLSFVLKVNLNLKFSVRRRENVFLVSNNANLSHLHSATLGHSIHNRFWLWSALGGRWFMFKAFPTPQD